MKLPAKIKSPLFWLEDALNFSSARRSLPTKPLYERIAMEQVNAIFSTATFGVAAATVAGLTLVGYLIVDNFLSPERGLIWIAVLCLTDIAHIFLAWAYRQAQPVADEDMGGWTKKFISFCFIEALVWGWAPFELMSVVRTDATLATLLVYVGVVAGASLAYGPYLPAFFSFFTPSLLGAIWVTAWSTDPLLHMFAPLLVIFGVGISGLALMVNRIFFQLIRLRFQTEAMADDLLQQKEIAEQANRAKSTFLAAASHDLRQPLHAIGLFVGALQSVVVSETGGRLVEQIGAAATAMDDLFTALLDMSRLEARSVEVNPKSFRVGVFLDRICEEYAEAARIKGLSLTHVSSACVIYTDPILLERILRNFVSNAIRYTERGKILVGCRRRGSKLAFQVLDTGPGIARDQKERIFEEYYQLGNPERDRAKGLGLGLAIVRQLARLLESDLSVRSDVGRGSCFEIIVPVADREHEVVTGHFPEEIASQRGGFILLIDDELMIREAMCALLPKWGHEIVAAGSEEEAIALFSQASRRPDLIVCDYRLRDGANGIEVIARLRNKFGAAIPAALITGDSSPQRLAEARGSGLALLQKPVPNAKLRAAISNLLAARTYSDR